MASELVTSRRAELERTASKYTDRPAECVAALRGDIITDIAEGLALIGVTGGLIDILEYAADLAYAEVPDETTESDLSRKRDIPMTYPTITTGDGHQPDNDQPSEPPEAADFAAASAPPKMSAGGLLPPLADATARYIEVATSAPTDAEEPAPSPTAMPSVHGLDGSSIQVSLTGAPDGMRLNLIGGVHTTTAVGDHEQAMARIGIREAVVLAHCIVVLARRRGYDIPDTLAEAAALDHEERQRWAEPDADTGEAYDTDTVGALGEAATWARRWSTERDRADALAAELARVDALHVPYVDEHGTRRCRGCIAGYDPHTRDLTHCAYPCPTARARGGELPLL